MRMRFVIDFFGLFCVDGLYTYIDYMHIGGSASDPRMPRASNDRKVKAPRRSDVINVRIETTGSKDNFTDKGQIAMVRNERERELSMCVDEWRVGRRCGGYVCV
jgi:hypothetical protein